MHSVSTYCFLNSIYANQDALCFFIRSKAISLGELLKIILQLYNYLWCVFIVLDLERERLRRVRADRIKSRARERRDQINQMDEFKKIAEVERLKKREERESIKLERDKVIVLLRLGL